MKIGIDAKWYFEGPPSGQRVVKCLIDHILLLDKTNEYFIILDKRHKKKSLISNNDLVKQIYLWAGNNFLSNVLLLPLITYKYKLDLVLCQNFVPLFCRGKKVAYIHDALFLSFPQYYSRIEKLYFTPMKYLAKKSDLIVTISNAEKLRLLQFGFKTNQKDIAVVYHGIEQTFKTKEERNKEELHFVKEKYQLPDEYLLYVGRINARKNIDTLLRSIPLLKNKLIPLIIVGAEDWKQSSYSEMMKDLNVAGRVSFTGSVTDNELGIIYALATVFCFPSFAEGFGLPPVEAMASGIPAVVSNTTSLPEVCGESGTYFNPSNAAELALKIDRLLENEQLYLEKKEIGIEWSSRFTWKNSAGKLIAIMEKL